jgi:hypothetical protein
MIIEMRTYTLRPGTMAEVEKRCQIARSMASNLPPSGTLKWASSTSLSMSGPMTVSSSALRHVVPR